MKIELKTVALSLLASTLFLSGLVLAEESENQKVHADAEPASSWKPATLKVIRRQADRPGHDSAVVSIVLTEESPPRYGLVFIQTKKNNKPGAGIVCNDAWQLGNGTDDAYECWQTVENTIEKLRVGHLESKFCVGLRGKLDKELGEVDNPILKPDSCPGGKDNCLCYEIDHCDRETGTCKNDPGTVKPLDEQILPPGNGSGTGGGNN